MQLHDIASVLEPNGPLILLVSFIFVATVVASLCRLKKLLQHRRIVLAAAVALLTPVVYFGHPLILAPLWIFAFNGISAAFSVFAIWLLLFLAANWLVTAVLRERSRQNRPN